MNAQNIWENPNSQVYGYLNRMAQKGLIQLNDLIKPINRVDIQFALNELSSKKEQLTPIEILELDFYLQEYKSIQETNTAILKAIQKDANKRLRGLFLHQKDFTLNVDPLGSLARISTNGNSFTQMSHGLNFWGQAKQFAFQFYQEEPNHET